MHVIVTACSFETSLKTDQHKGKLLVPFYKLFSKVDFGKTFCAACFIIRYSEIFFLTHLHHVKSEGTKIF
jgi:hypothetical protein